MGKLLKAALKILAVVVVGGGVVVVVISAGGLMWYRGLPKVEVTNQCTDAIVIPEQVRVVPAIPESIPVGGSITVPVISGSGEYSLYKDGDGTFIRLPSAIPVLGDSIRVGSAATEPDVTFEGAPVTIPMSRQLDDQNYSVVLCP